MGGFDEETMQYQDQTKFNMAFAYLMRVNALFYQANEASRQDNIAEWFKCCMNIYKELRPKMDAKLIASSDKYMELGEAAVKQFISQYNSYVATNQNNKMGMPFIANSAHVKLLFNWENELRMHTDKIGMLMPSSDDPRFSILS